MQHPALALSFFRPERIKDPSSRSSIIQLFFIQDVIQFFQSGRIFLQPGFLFSNHVIPLLNLRLRERPATLLR